MAAISSPLFVIAAFALLISVNNGVFGATIQQREGGDSKKPMDNSNKPKGNFEENEAKVLANGDWDASTPGDEFDIT